MVCFDNRVQVVASAGSGKTSTMVARAAYAIHRGFVTPERIILLAFNKQAAEERRQVVRAAGYGRCFSGGLDLPRACLYLVQLHRCCLRCDSFVQTQKFDGPAFSS